MILQKILVINDFDFLNMIPHSILVHSFMIPSSRHVFILKQTSTLPWPQNFYHHQTLQVPQCISSFFKFWATNWESSFFWSFTTVFLP